MSWTQILNDVTSRISAASQSLNASDPVKHRTYPSTVSFSDTQSCSSASHDPQFPSSMSVRVQLDQQNGFAYTNQDQVTGRVILNLATDTTITAINVKLEGESKTRLSGPKFQNDPKNRQKIELEVHKLLYKVQTVFPSQSIAQSSINSQYTLPAGQYAYPFSFRIPFNNDCVNNQRLFQDIRLAPLLVQDLTDVKHVKQTLPPSLSGFPGEAEIKYYVKATVVRPKFYQENIRSMVDIKLQPVEPPRPEPRNEETYARRQHQFQSPSTTTTPKSSKSSLFSKKSSTVQVNGPTSIKVEARLPSPTIVSCNKPLPLRILVEKTNDSPATLYLSLLQIELIGYTNIRARDLRRVETGSWILMSQANIKMSLGSLSDNDARSFQIPTRYWDQIPLPNTVAPSFKGCNNSRSYELEVRIGISHGRQDGVNPELVVLALRIPVEVFSGIRPPPQFLSTISTQPTQEASSSNLAPPKLHDDYNEPSPVTPGQDQYPAQPGKYMSPSVEDDPNDLPPSYEDAIAEAIVPVDGPRRTDGISEPPQYRRQSTNTDSKSNTGGLGRHGSERLFSQNAPSPPSLSVASEGQQQTVPPTNESVSDLLAGMNVNGSNFATGRNPPPLPARKATKDSVKGSKGAT